MRGDCTIFESDLQYFCCIGEGYLWSVKNCKFPAGEKESSRFARTEGMIMRLSSFRRIWLGAHYSGMMGESAAEDKFGYGWLFL